LSVEDWAEIRRLHRGNGCRWGNAEELMCDHLAKARQIAPQFPRFRTRLDTAATRPPTTPSSSALQAILDGLEAQLPAKDGACIRPTSRSSAEN
jgi:hypothetical protein